MSMKIRDVAASDAGSIAAIYNHFVVTSTVTFEEVEIPVLEMANTIKMVKSSGMPWYVATNAETLIGYAYASPWRARSAYRRSAEVTVYVAPARSGSGIGTALYRRLLSDLEERMVHSALAGIASPNPQHCSP